MSVNNDCNFKHVLAEACKSCKYSADHRAGQCSYGTPVCIHDSRIKCYFEKERTESVKPFPPAYIDEEYCDGSEEP